MFWWFAGQIIDIFSGDLDTFLGKLLGYFVIFAVFATIFGWQILKICYNSYIVN